MKKRLLRLFKGILFISLVFVTIIFAIYTMAWFALTKKAEVYLTAAWQDKSVIIMGDRPHFGGFPMPPEAHFSGKIIHESGLKIESPQIYYSGFPVSHQVQYFEAPQGLKITAPFIDRDLNFEFAALQMRLPYKFPATTEKSDIEEWQKTGDPFTIHKIVLNSGKISAIGYGTIQLDDNLQIKADLNARVVGMDLLFDELEKEQGERTMAIARNFLNMMTKTDPITGQRYFETTLKIQNRGMYFGPMRISGLPEIKWRE